MAKYKVISGGVCAAKGFSASGVHAGFRANPNKLDLAIIKADVRCAAAGVYTTNKVYGAPIKVDRAHLVDGHAQAVLVNSGNANTCAANGVRPRYSRRSGQAAGQRRGQQRSCQGHYDHRYLRERICH